MKLEIKKRKNSSINLLPDYYQKVFMITLFFSVSCTLFPYTLCIDLTDKISKYVLRLKTLSRTVHRTIFECKKRVY